MITLTRISGSQFILNCELIERIETTPDTVIALVDGKRYVVADTPAAVVHAIREHRSRIIAMSAAMELEDAPTTEPVPIPRLTAVPSAVRGQ